MTVAVMATGTIAIALALFAPQRRSGSARVDGYRVVHTYPHDRDAFTQGLIVRDGYFYEGTGLVGRSGLRKVKIDTGEVVQFKALEPPYFGEGITEWKGTLVQLTWQTDRIARISPKSGQVLGWIDLRGLLPPAERSRDAVLNGIAYDAKANRLFVTGKLWPRVFEITIASTSAPRAGGRGDDESARR